MARQWLGTKSYTEYTSTTGGVGLVAYDATGSGGSASSGTNSVNIQWSHTASGSNRAVVVAVMVGGLNAAESTYSRTCTYGGTSMTSLGVEDATTNGFIEFFGLLNPATGAQTVSFTVSKASASFGRVVGNSVSYTNVSGFGTPYLSALSASTGTWITSTKTWSGNMAGSKVLVLIGVDSAASITTLQTVNNYYTETSVIPPMQDTTIRWSNNNTGGAGITSAALSEMPGAMHSTAHTFPSVASHSLTIMLPIMPVGVPVPDGVRGCWLTMIGAGGAGGSGRQGASFSNRWGGDGGGGGAQVAERYISVDMLGSTYNLYVPPRADGGVGQATATSNGNYGKRSGDVMFGSGDITISCGSGHGGMGGGTAAPIDTVWGGLTGDSFGYGSDSGSGNSGAGFAGNNALAGNGYTCPSGGGGGGISSGNAAGAGGAGGSNKELSLTGGSGGAVGGASPGAGSAATAGVTGGAAGGGAASAAGAPQAGASATAYGAGGGGGGASVNGQTSGAGGMGGPAYARITWDYR